MYLINAIDLTRASRTWENFNQMPQEPVTNRLWLYNWLYLGRQGSYQLS